MINGHELNLNLDAPLSARGEETLDKIKTAIRRSSIAAIQEKIHSPVDESLYDSRIIDRKYTNYPHARQTDIYGETRYIPINFIA